MIKNPVYFGEETNDEILDSIEREIENLHGVKYSRRPKNGLRSRSSIIPRNIHPTVLKRLSDSTKTQTDDTTNRTSLAHTEMAAYADVIQFQMGRVRNSEAKDEGSVRSNSTYSTDMTMTDQTDADKEVLKVSRPLLLTMS